MWRLLEFLLLLCSSAIIIINYYYYYFLCFLLLYIYVVTTFFRSSTFFFFSLLLLLLLDYYHQSTLPSRPSSWSCGLIRPSIPAERCARQKPLHETFVSAYNTRYVYAKGGGSGHRYGSGEARR